MLYYYLCPILLRNGTFLNSGEFYFYILLLSCKWTRRHFVILVLPGIEMQAASRDEKENLIKVLQMFFK